MLCLRLWYYCSSQIVIEKRILMPGAFARKFLHNNGSKTIFSDDCYWFYNVLKPILKKLYALVFASCRHRTACVWYSIMRWKSILFNDKKYVHYKRENSVIRTKRYLKLRIKKIFQPVVDTYTENRCFGFNTPSH